MGDRQFVTENVCERRTGAILKEVKCVKAATTKIDKDLAVLIATQMGKDSVLGRVGGWVKVIMFLIFLAGLVWGAARLIPPTAPAVASDTGGDPT